jgi:Fe2+ transport system protein FeoA
VVRVAEGEVKTVHVSGGQHFGSGGYSASSCYAGKEPELVAGSERYESTSFISDSYADFRFRAPSIVYMSSGDCIGKGGRDFGKTVYVCASDEQIAAAIAEVKEQRRKDCEGADITVLKQFLKDNMGAMESHRRSSHSKGCCWDGDGHSYASEKESQVTSIRVILESGELDEGLLAHLDSVVAKAVRFVVYNNDTKEQRLKVYHEAETEREIEKKAEGKAFARSQIDKLVEMGFSRGCAVKIMKAAGPGRCIQAVEWARYALDTIGSVDALDCLLSGAGGTHGFGKDRMEGALKAFGLEPPGVSSSTALFAVLAGAKAALLAGLPEPEGGAR